MEVLGGNGYVEEGPLARVYREMPVNSIWEGSGNIMCLDVLRAFGKSAETATILLDELARQRGRHRAYDTAFERFASRLTSVDGLAEAQARSLVRELVTLEQAALLLQSDVAVVGDAYCASRLDPAARWGAVPGEGIPVAAARAVIDRAYAS